MTASIEEIGAKILAFLGDAMVRVNHESCVKLELVYAPQGQFRNDTLRAWRRDAETDAPAFEPGRVFTERLTSDVLEIAENFADSYGAGRHRFMLRVYSHLGARRVHPFVLLPNAENAPLDDGSGEGTALTRGEVPGVPGSSPTAAGLVSQLMRHLEVKERSAMAQMNTFLSAIGHHTQQQREENDRLREQNAELMRERTAYMAQIEAAKSVEHAQQIEATQIMAKEERKTLATKKIVNLLPVAISQWMSVKSHGTVGDMTPAAPSPLAIAAGELFGSLAGDQRGKLEGMLSIEGRIMLSEVVRVVTAGGSPLLPTMVSDLIRSFDQRQLMALMGLFTVEQQGRFVKVMQLANAATGEAAAPPQAAETAEHDAPINGAEHHEGTS